MGHSILRRMDDMGTRMDELEQSIAALLQQTGLDQNGFSSNTSFDTATSFPTQSKVSPQVSATVPPNNISKPTAQSKLQAPTSPTASVLPPVSAVNDSPFISSLSHVVSPTDQDKSATTARARVTIEI